MNKTQSVRIHSRLWLYKQGGSSRWYARVRVGGVTKAKSTHTRDQQEAIERAEAFFLERMKLCAAGERTAVAEGHQASRRFAKVAGDFLDRKRSELSDREWHNLRNLLMAGKGPVSVFRWNDVADITTDRIRQYLQYVKSKPGGGTMSPHTLKRYVSAFSGILRLAAERQLIPAVPPLPRIRVKDSPRSWFTDTEYRRLCTAAHQRGQQASSGGQQQEASDWHDLGDLIAFLVNTFIRPSEWKHLCHRDVAVERAGPNPHLLISLKRGKTGARSVITMPSAVKVYDRLMARNGHEPGDFLFLNRYQNRETAQEKMGRRFRKLVEETGLRFDSFGRPRTLYCLRHTALMLRLLKADGLDLLTLAKAGGTSVPMLERFYLSHLGPAMKLANLQSFKPRREGEKSSPLLDLTE